MLPTWVRKLDLEIAEFVPFCGTLKDQSFQKVLLVLTHLGIETCIFSTPLISFFPLRSISRWLYTWSRLFVSKYSKIWSLHRKWNPDRPEMAKVLLIQKMFEIPTRPSQKLQLWILLLVSELPLPYYYRTVRVKNLWFCSDIEFFYQVLHRQLFSL